MNDWTVTLGDCLDVMRTMPDASVDAIVSDPPYGLIFMRRNWDCDVPAVDVWRECLRVLKPGGHMLAFAGTRTQHRMACRIEDSGFEIRDMIAWMYGNGFPKSHDVSKAIDKSAGAEREVVGYKKLNERDKKVYEPKTKTSFVSKSAGINDKGLTAQKVTAPSTEAAKQWDGWGTALKPAMEPITVARKPLDGTVAENVLTHGTGALNVDGCRVGTDGGTRRNGKADTPNDAGYANMRGHGIATLNAGRWPANVIHDGSDEVVGLFPETGPSKETQRNNGESKSIAKGRDIPHVAHGYNDTGGSAARFFYTCKASTNDRDHGATGLHWLANESRGSGWCQITREHWQRLHEANKAAKEAKQPPPHRIATGNVHTTVKPTDLMRYLVTLVTPPGGLVLDPFAGSGSTGRGARLAGMRFHGIERDPDYVEIARARIAAAHLWTPDSAVEELDPRQGELFF